MHGEHELGELIATAHNLSALGEAARRAAKSLGFEHFLYGLRRVHTLGGTPRQWLLCGYPKAWRDRYDEQGYLLIDPVMTRCIEGVSPFGWDELPRDSAPVQRLFEEAAGHGLVHGLSVPLHGFQGEFGMLCLARKTALPQGAARTRLFQRAQWLTGLLQSRLRQWACEQESGSADAAPLADTGLAADTSTGAPARAFERASSV